MTESDKPPPFTIRLAAVADAEALATLHIQSWQWAYRGQISDAYLDALPETLPRRIESRRAELERMSPESRWWLAERAGRLVGFAATGPSRDDDAVPTTGEVRAIYLAEKAAGQGIGRALFAHAVDDLRQRGFRAATLWVLASNTRARRFYAAAGWAPDGAEKTEERLGVVLHEVRYRVALP
jgi:GNAT superfamily N-acetyltransferase